jgi:hypothetical protein
MGLCAKTTAQASPVDLRTSKDARGLRGRFAGVRSRTRWMAGLSQAKPGHDGLAAGANFLFPFSKT